MGASVPLGMYLTRLNRTLKNGSRGTFHVHFITIFFKCPSGVPGWVAQSVERLTLAQVMVSLPWARAPHRALCSQLRAWTALWTLCLPLSPPLMLSLLQQ